MNKCGLILIILAIVLGVAIELAAYFILKTIGTKLNDGLQLTGPSDSGYADFLETKATDAPTYLKVTFFNMTNAMDVLTKKAQPVLSEVGPYVFRKWTKKLDVSFGTAVYDGKAGEKTVSFKTHTWYTHEPSLTKAGLAVTDRITMPNPTYLGAITTAGGLEATALMGAIPSTLGKVEKACKGDFVDGLKANLLSSFLLGVLDQVNKLTSNRGLPQWLLAADAPVPAGMFTVSPPATSPLRGFELYTPGSSAPAEPLSLAQATQLWNPTSNTSFVYPGGALTWLSSTKSLSAAGALMLANSITMSQYTAIVTWLGAYMLSPYFEGGVLPTVKAGLNAIGIADSANVAKWEDLGYMQFTTGKVATLSAAPGVAKTFAPSGPAPEIAIFCANSNPACSAFGTPFSLTIAQARAVFAALEGPSANLKSFLGNAQALPVYCDSTKPSFDRTRCDAITAYYAGSFSNLTPNSAVAIAQYLTASLVPNFIVAGLAPIILTPAGGGGLIADRSVSEWLFKFDDPFLKAFLPSGWDKAFLGNATDEGVTLNTTQADVIYTGVPTVKARRQYVSYAGETFVGEKTNISWPGPEVRIAGTDATSFKPGLTSKDTITAYVNFIYRPAQLAFSKHSTVKGVPTLSYAIPDSVLAVNPNFDQYLHGVFNITRMRGTPLLITKPHFLDTTEDLKKLYPALTPDPALHDFVVEVEPMTGLVINGAKRLQYSLQIGPTDRFFTNATAITAPLFWVEEGGILKDSDATKLKQVRTGVVVSLALFIGGFVFAGVFIIIGVIVCLCKRNERPASSRYGNMQKMTEL